MLEERNQLSERLEAVTHDKLLPVNHIDSDTPIQKTLKLLQTLILVSICCAWLLTVCMTWWLVHGAVCLHLARLTTVGGALLGAQVTLLTQAYAVCQPFSS